MESLPIAASLGLAACLSVYVALQEVKIAKLRKRVAYLEIASITPKPPRKSARKTKKSEG